MPEILPGTGEAEKIDPALAVGARRSRRVILVALLVVALVGVGLAVLWNRDGLWTPRWGARDVAICPVQLMAPAAASTTKVNVYNAGSQQGSATRTGRRLAERDFLVGTVANAKLDGPAPERPGVIMTGASTASQALAVQRQVRGTVVVVQAQRTDGTIDLFLGTGFHGLVPADQVSSGPGRLACVRGVFITPER